MKKSIKFGIGFATGRKSFRKVLNAYINNWSETRKKLPPDVDVSLNLFVAYDLEYLNTKSTDYTNLSQEIVDAFDDIVFLGAKNTQKSVEHLTKSEELTSAELRSVFGSGYAGKRNAILFAALENQVDYLLFLDDDEYPVAVTNNHDICLWSGQHVLLTHVRYGTPIIQTDNIAVIFPLFHISDLMRLYQRLILEHLLKPSATILSVGKTSDI